MVIGIKIINYWLESNLHTIENKITKFCVESSFIEKGKEKGKTRVVCKENHCQ